MTAITGARLHVGSVESVQSRGCVQVSGGGYGIAVFAHEGRFFAVDNRCPHMGFPLSRGTVHDGLLTCHWHHARFDLEGGGTLDPFADNVRTFPVVVEDGSVYVLAEDRPDQTSRTAYWFGRLEEGLEHSLEFVLAKSTIALLGSGVDARDVVRTIGRYGLRYRARGWGMGMTILTAIGWVLPELAVQDRALALFHGAIHVAEDTRGSSPRFDLEPLPSTDVAPERLEVWFRRAVEVRDQDGAERVLQTAISNDASPIALATMLFAAATDHVYLDAGHVLDFINKACEYLDLVGWAEARQALPSLVDGLCRAQRSEEQNAWRHPVDLIELVAPHLERLSRLSPGDLALNAGFDALLPRLSKMIRARGLRRSARRWSAVLRRPKSARRLLTQLPSASLDFTPATSSPIGTRCTIRGRRPRHYRERSNALHRSRWRAVSTTRRYASTSIGS
jgi:nitrite reductase/ring-hydroxylating ferredoxin subunit